MLTQTGSLYLHVDPNTSHYLKVMLDGIFGRKNFRNEIVWSYRGGPRAVNGTGTNFSRQHDVILRHVKHGKPTWNQLYDPLSDSTIKRSGLYRQEFYTCPSTGTMKRKPTNEISLGMPMRDVWEITDLRNATNERVDYPTQKPIALLDRIIRASSNAGDLVLDPFCGSGTTLAAARQLGRRYIGIDQNPNAIELCEKRLAQTQPALIPA